MAGKNNSIKRLAVTAILTAILVVMAFTPIGYLKIGVVSITFMTIPVVIGAIIEGPMVGMFLGLVFGITSLIQCFGTDTFGTTLMSINAFYTVIMCLIPRLLAGLFSGLVYKVIANKTKSKLGYIISTFSVGFFNTVLFVGCLLLFFFKSDYIQSIGTTIPAVISAMITFNAIIEWVTCTVVGTAVCVAVNRTIKHQK